MTKAGSNTVTRKLKMEVLIQVIACLLAQSCLTLCNPMDWEILEWVVISSSRGSFWCRDQTCVSYISYTAGGFSACWAISREIHPVPMFSLLQHWKKNLLHSSEMICLTWQTSEESIFSFKSVGICPLVHNVILSIALSLETQCHLRALMEVGQEQRT